MAAAMVDGVYQDIAEALKPGVQESQIVALATKRLYEMGSDCVEAINSISGDAAAAPAQLHRSPDPPGRPGVLRHHPVVHGLPHLLLPHLQRRAGHAGAAHRLQEGARVDGPGDRAAQARHDQRQGGGDASRRPRRLASRARWTRSASTSATASASGCTSVRLSPPHLAPRADRAQGGHGVRRETYCPATDGVSAARIEEEVILTPRAVRRSSPLYPAEELPIANPY